jgi:hypothetical protein
MRLKKDLECGFSSHPNTLQHLPMALTAVATVYTGKSKFHNVSGCSLFRPETKNDCDSEGQLFMTDCQYCNIVPSALHYDNHRREKPLTV